LTPNSLIIKGDHNQNFSLFHFFVHDSFFSSPEVIDLDDEPRRPAANPVNNSYVPATPLQPNGAANLNSIDKTGAASISRPNGAAPQVKFERYERICTPKSEKYFFYGADK